VGFKPNIQQNIVVVTGSSYFYRPVTDCKMNDLEWLFHVKLGFTNSFRFRGFDFEAQLRQN